MRAAARSGCRLSRIIDCVAVSTCNILINCYFCTALLLIDCHFKCNMSLCSVMQISLIFTPERFSNYSNRNFKCQIDGPIVSIVISAVFDDEW